MNRDPILFRVDGMTRSGWENLTRCLTLAGALQRRRRPTYFLSQLDPASLALPMKRAGHSWLEADGPTGSADDLAETLQEIRRLNPAAVIIDAPEVSEDYLAALSATGVMVVCLDNLAGIRFPSRLVINPLPGPTRESYEFEPGTQLLLGPRYTLVRPEIRRVRPLRAQEPAQPFRGLVWLDDTESWEHAEKLVQTLLNIPKVARLDLVIRSHQREQSPSQALAAAYPDRLELASEPAEITARLARCHFAIAPGNGVSLELACIGVPQLLVVQREAHWPTAQRLEEEGAALCLGWHANVSPQTIRQSVQELLGDPHERQAMARCGRQLIDGRGPDRLVTGLEVLLHPSRLLDFCEAA